MSRKLIISLALAASALAPAARAADKPLDTASIESITGLKGTYNEAEKVFKVSKPRTDIKPNIDGWAMPPFMGLTSSAAFMRAQGATMVMGDTVLLEDEVNPAMSAALEGGLEVTALHNHFFFDQPRVYFMHIGGMGDTQKLATGVKAVYDRIAEVRAAKPAPATAFSGEIANPSSISAGPIESVFGTKAQTNGGMAKVVIGRTTRMHGTNVGNEMGVNTWAAFAGSDDQAVVDGDFAMRESELQTVLKTMRAEGINILAIHQHMTFENPRIVFLHYWGKGKAVDLARSVKKALVAQQAVK
ncbi:MAG: protein of unknown function LppY and LpqO [Ramlibacter sp.]|jgi:hypothetical protein|nr:protein of unknown function LppY and LpqO [Ramlibacter sp.]